MVDSKLEAWVFRVFNVLCRLSFLFCNNKSLLFVSSSSFASAVSSGVFSMCFIFCLSTSFWLLRLSICICSCCSLPIFLLSSSFSSFSFFILSFASFSSFWSSFWNSELLLLFCSIFWLSISFCLLRLLICTCSCCAFSVFWFSCLCKVSMFLLSIAAEVSDETSFASSSLYSVCSLINLSSSSFFCFASCWSFSSISTTFVLTLSFSWLSATLSSSVCFLRKFMELFNSVCLRRCWFISTAFIFSISPLSAKSFCDFANCEDKTSLSFWRLVNDALREPISLLRESICLSISSLAVLSTCLRYSI